MKHAHTIPGRIFQHVQARPEQTCLVFRDINQSAACDDVSLTYGDLWGQAAGLARQLEFLRPADHVIIVMPLCAELLVAHLSVLLRSAVASIFTHPSEKIASAVYAEKLHHAISIFHPRAVITTGDFIEEVRSANRENNAEILLFPDFPLNGDGLSEQWKFASSDATAIVQYSSGSTGMQKAVALSHSMVIGQCESYARAISLEPAKDLICSWLPLYHDMGLFSSWLMPVLNGVTVAHIDPFQWVKQPQSLFQLITDYRGTLCWLPNFSFNLLAQRVGGELQEGLDLSSMRGFVNCSEPVSASSMESFYQAFSGAGVRRSSLWTCYAMAENSFAVSSATGDSALANTVRVDSIALGEGVIKICDDVKGIAFVSCGPPIEGTEVAVFDAGTGNPSTGRVGELVLKSPYMLKSYFKNEDATASAIDSNGWYHTGDLGFIHEGNVYVTGRKKDLLIVGGRNFYPQDIERICDRFEGSIPGRSVALGMRDERMGTEQAILLMESRLEDEGAKASLAASVRKAVFDELDCPLADIRVVPYMWLLKTSSGKIARQPNLNKYRQAFHPDAARDAGQVLETKQITSWLAMLGWSFAVAVSIYTAVLLSGLGTNQSWNIYMRF